MGQNNNPLEALFVSKEDEAEKPIYAKISAGLHSKVLEVKAKSNKTIAELVEMGLQVVVNEYEKRQNKDAKNGKAA